MRFWLKLAEGNLEYALTLFWEAGGVDYDGIIQGSQNHEARFPVNEQAMSDFNFPSHSAPTAPVSSGGSSQGAGVRSPIRAQMDRLVDTYDLNDQIRTFPHNGFPFGGIRPIQPSIFDQSTQDVSIWGNPEANTTDEEGEEELEDRSSRLARLFRPPFSLMTPVGLDQARSLAQGQQKLIMVNIQDTTEFDCQVLNRDVWKDESVQAMVKTNFIFLQYKNESTQGKQYISWYQVKGYPHIAILDPVTGILVFLLVNLAD